MKNCIISPQDNASRGIFRHHKSSVEDIQWHPNSENIFASCSSDRSISIWDKREFMSRSSSNYRNLHQKDINVISWHQNNCNYILSGSDDCLIKLWDLRKIDMDDQSKPQACLKTFLWHSDSIQSLEWSPNDPNLFAACSSDDTLTLWDLYWSDDSDNKQSGDEKEGAKNKKKKSKQKIASEPPKELFFDHRSLNQVKELHWIKDRETEKSNGEIPNATGTLVSIDINGYDIFSPIDS
ncbi:MAG: Ribosome assembly protein rrb1 [Marteilia pararefringens]